MNQLRVRDRVINTSVENIVNRSKIEAASIGINKLKHIREIRDSLQVTCPFHKNGQERKPSCGIVLKDTTNSRGEKVPVGTFHCFACGMKGPLSRFISGVFNAETDEFGEKWILDNFDSDEFKNTRNLLNLPLSTKTETDKIEYVTESELAKYRYYHPYMYERKLTNEIIEKFDIGYDKDTDCITFPVYDEFGRCVFVARRSVKTKYFNYPSGSKKPIYGLEKIDKDTNAVLVVESFLNALTSWIYGQPAVALMGLGSEDQYNILRQSSIKKFILAFDGDEQGDKGREDFIKALKPYKLISYVRVPRGKDINDLTKEEFDSLQEYWT